MEEFHWKYPMSWLKFGRVSKWKVTTETFHLTEMAQTVGRERLLQFALVFWLNKAPDFFLNKTVETLRFLNNFSLRLKILQNFSLHYNDNSKAASCRLQVADGICTANFADRSAIAFWLIVQPSEYRLTRQGHSGAMRLTHQTKFGTTSHWPQNKAFRNVSYDPRIHCSSATFNLLIPSNQNRKIWKATHK